MYRSANTAATRSEIEVARSPLSEAIRNQSSDSAPTSEGPTMARHAGERNKSHVPEFESSSSHKTLNEISPTRHPGLYPGCSKIFTRPDRLHHHPKIHFSETVTLLDCPYARGRFCGREGHRGFRRDDLRKEHIRIIHPAPEQRTQEVRGVHISTFNHVSHIPT